MYYLYCIKNLIDDVVYVGMTNNLSRRWTTHVHSCNNGNQSKLYAAMRKYGIDKFKMELVNEFYSKEDCCAAEIFAISFLTNNNIKHYNLHSGGTGGFVVQDKEEWIKKLKDARKGKQPALGMKHTKDNKQIFSNASKRRWDENGRYPKEVLNYSFKEAHSKFGISKTHYYRLKKDLI